MNLDGKKYIFMFITPFRVAGNENDDYQYLGLCRQGRSQDFFVFNNTLRLLQIFKIELLHKTSKLQELPDLSIDLII